MSALVPCPCGCAREVFTSQKARKWHYPFATLKCAAVDAVKAYVGQHYCQGCEKWSVGFHCDACGKIIEEQE